MRPEHLLVEGLRSYKDQTEIDFSELGLTALIGDTGAGKSSIIEALSVALYNRPTWSGRGVQSLRADNAPAMKVILSFTVTVSGAKQRWTVTRIHRAGTSPAVHKLVCDDTGEKLDNEGRITKRIEALVGLTHEQFTKAVAIPQGQFARLLEATEVERTKILKGIFRLDHLSVIKDHADGLHRRYADRVSRRRGERETLPDDPSAALAAAAAEAEAEAAEMRRLTLAAQTAKEQAQRAGAAGQDAVRLSDAVAEVTGRVRPADLDTLAVAAAAADGIDAEVAAAEDEKSRAEDDEAAWAGKAVEAIAPFASRDEAGAARATIDDVAATATRLAAQVEELKARRVALEDPAGARQRAEAADKAETLRAAATVKGDELAALDERCEQAKTLADTSKRTLDALRRRLDGTERALASAREALDAAVEANALATVAGDCQPGDDCPVCARPLPKGFVAPSDAGIDQARVDLAEAQTALAGVKVEVERADEQAREAAAELERLRGERETASRAAADADRLARDAEDGAGKLETDHRRDVADLERDENDLATEGSRCQAKLDALPERFIHQVGDAAAATAATEAISKALSDGTEAETRVAAARDLAVAAANRAGRAEARRAGEVRTPVTTVREQAVGLADRVTALSGRLTEAVELPTHPGAEAPVNALTAWVAALHAAATRAAEAGTDQAAVLNAKAAAEAAAADAACHEAGAETLAALEEMVTSAQRRSAVASHTVTLIEAQQARAAWLDQFLQVGEPFVANVDTLRQTLTDGQFIRSLVAERERELLVEASRKLRDLTGDNFGFGEGFKIVDRRTGQQRPGETLSGGERFLPSLALALGLVEIATRGGGQLDAMFLDEGFASLDSASLDQALVTLGTLAVGGKLVMLVSHLRRVAEHVDQVLFVKRDEMLGSRIRRLDPDERDALLAEDVRSGLVR